MVVAALMVLVKVLLPKLNDVVGMARANSLGHCHLQLCGIFGLQWHHQGFWQ
jgi:hypothetical protein